MKRALTASLTALLIGWNPAAAADGPPREVEWHSGARTHDFLGQRPIHRRWVPGFIWIGHRHDPLWSWDDGFFTDLKYRHDRYGLYSWRKYRPSGEVEVVNGEARYHYDRGYPYDHYDYGRAGGRDWHSRRYDESASVSCRTQWVWSDRDQKDVPVRICS